VKEDEKMEAKRGVDEERRRMKREEKGSAFNNFLPFLFRFSRNMFT